MSDRMANSDPNEIGVNGQAKRETNAEESSHKQTQRDRARRPYTPSYEPPHRRPHSERENSFEPLVWLLEGATGLIEELRHNDLGLNEEFWIHLYATRREGLLTARAFIDSLLAQLDEEARKNEESQERRARRGGIDIDF